MPKIPNSFPPHKRWWVNKDLIAFLTCANYDFSSNHTIQIPISICQVPLACLCPSEKITSKFSNKFEQHKDKIIINTLGRKTVTSKDIDWWFAKSRLNRFSVLKFHSANLTIKYENTEWWQKLEKAIAFSNYMQQPTRIVHPTFTHKIFKKQKNNITNV